MDTKDLKDLDLNDIYNLQTYYNSLYSCDFNFYDISDEDFVFFKNRIRHIVEILEKENE